MNNRKTKDSSNKTNKTFDNKSAKFSAHQRNSFDNIISDVNLDIIRINKKIDKQTDYQIHIQSLMEEEIKLRQEIEKKIFLINENLTAEVNKIKQNLTLFSNDIQENFKNNLQKVIDDNQMIKLKISGISDSIIGKIMNEFKKKKYK